MQNRTKQLHKAIAKVIRKQRKEKGIKYTKLCDENGIPTSSYDDIVNAKTKASFYNIARIVKALGLSFEQFGKILDNELPKDYYESEL